MEERRHDYIDIGEFLKEIRQDIREIVKSNIEAKVEIARLRENQGTMNVQISALKKRVATHKTCTIGYTNKQVAENTKKINGNGKFGLMQWNRIIVYWLALLSISMFPKLYQYLKGFIG